MDNLVFDHFRTRAVHLSMSRHTHRPSRGRLLALFYEYVLEASNATMNETAFSRMLQREFPTIARIEHPALFRFVSGGSYIISLDKLVTLLIPPPRALQRRHSDPVPPTRQPLRSASRRNRASSATSRSSAPATATSASAPAPASANVTSQYLTAAAEQLKVELAEYTKRSRPRIRLLFNAIDGNGNGSVGPFEMADYLRRSGISKACTATCRRLVRFFDSTGTSALNFEDFLGMLVPTKHAAHSRVSSLSAGFLKRMGSSSSNIDGWPQAPPPLPKPSRHGGTPSRHSPRSSPSSKGNNANGVLLPPVSKVPVCPPLPMAAPMVPWR